MYTFQYTRRDARALLKDWRQYRLDSSSNLDKSSKAVFKSNDRLAKALSVVTLLSLLAATVMFILSIFFALSEFQEVCAVIGTGFAILALASYFLFNKTNFARTRQRLVTENDARLLSAFLDSRDINNPSRLNIFLHFLAHWEDYVTGQKRHAVSLAVTIAVGTIIAAVISHFFNQNDETALAVKLVFLYCALVVTYLVGCTANYSIAYFHRYNELSYLHHLLCYVASLEASSIPRDQIVKGAQQNSGVGVKSYA